MSLFVYLVLAGAGAVGLIWHIKLADVVAAASAPLGASFTFVPLLVMALAFKLYYLSVLLMRARSEVLERERASAWVRELARGT